MNLQFRTLIMHIHLFQMGERRTNHEISPIILHTFLLAAITHMPVDDLKPPSTSKFNTSVSSAG